MCSAEWPLANAPVAAARRKLQTYGGVPGELLEGIKEAYERQGGSGTLQNPRGAGRKKSTGQDEIRKVKSLREKGYTIRGIAEETGWSVGYVHKLINEHE